METAIEAKGDMDVTHLDTVALPSHFAVWLACEEAKFLRGKFVWANWDVNQLKAKREEIEGTMLLTCNVLGWPYSP